MNARVSATAASKIAWHRQGEATHGRQKGNLEGWTPPSSVLVIRVELLRVKAKGLFRN